MIRGRIARPLSLAATLAAAAGVLAACDKPIPEVTLQSGSDATTVKAQTFCFDNNHCHYRKSGGVGLRVRTPWVLLRGDYGIVFDQRAGEPRGRFYFSIGQAF